MFGIDVHCESHRDGTTRSSFCFGMEFRFGVCWKQNYSLLFLLLWAFRNIRRSLRSRRVSLIVRSTWLAIPVHRLKPFARSYHKAAHLDPSLAPGKSLLLPLLLFCFMSSPRSVVMVCHLSCFPSRPLTDTAVSLLGARESLPGRSGGSCSLWPSTPFPWCLGRWVEGVRVVDAGRSETKTEQRSR